MINEIDYSEFTLFSGFYKLRTKARILFCVIQLVGHRFTSSEVFRIYEPITGVKHPGNVGLELKTLAELGFIEVDRSGAHNVYEKTPQFYNLMEGRCV